MIKKKVFLSFPMNGYTEEQQKEMRDYMISFLDKDTEEPIDNFIEKPEGSERLYCLGEAIKKLGECDSILLHPKWESAMGCVVEATAAMQYGLKVATIFDPDCCHITKGVVQNDED